MAVLDQTVSGAVDYVDLIGAGIVKTLGEQMLMPVVGNANIKSGLVKLAIGFGARKLMGRGTMADSVSLGFSTDGVEDVLHALMGGMIGDTQEDMTEVL